MSKLKTQFFLTPGLAFALSAAWPSEAQTNGALVFNGVNQYVTVPNFGAIAPTNEVTVEFWANASQLAQQSAFMLQPDEGTNRFNCHVSYNNGNIYWDFGNIDTGGRVSAAEPPGTIGNWTHYALVASQSNNEMRIYVNGSLWIPAIGMTPFLRGSYALDIGGNTNFYFNGMLDDFRVWNTALSQQQIQSNMNITLTGSEPNLLLYYRFDEPGGNVASNSAVATGPRYNGILVNAPGRVLSEAPIGYAPSVTTLPAAAVGLNGASLSATVNPGGAATVFYFQYGPTVNYTSNTAMFPLPATNVSFNVSAGTGPLLASNAYHFRAVAANAIATNYGADSVFVTSPPLAVNPAGARIYQWSFNDAIVNGNQTTTYPVTLNAGQNLSLAVTPASNLWPSVTITDPTGAPFGFAVAAAAGEPALLNDAPILLSGTYTITFSGMDGTTGSYLATVALNAQFKSETFLDQANSTLATAEDIRPSAFPVGNGSQEMAVLGSLDGDASQPWPDPVDFYRFFLYQGQSAAVELASQSPGALQFALENGDGQVLALGNNDATNVNEEMENFVAPRSDFYYVGVSGDWQTSYALIVLTNAIFGLEPQAIYPSSQNLFGVASVCGNLPNGASLFYAVSVNAGDNLTLATQTPASGLPAAVNSLNPELLLFDNNGDLVAIADGNAGDGRNSIIEFTIPGGSGGTWYAGLTSGDGSFGDYVLNVQGATGRVPLQVVTGTAPAPGATVAPPASVTMFFQEAVDGLSLTPGELTVNGSPAAAVSLSGGNSVTWTTPGNIFAAGNNAPNVIALGTDVISGQQVTSLYGAATVPYSYTIFTSTALTPPTAGPVQLAAVENAVTNFSASLILANDSSPTGGPLSLTAVNSTNGASVVLTNSGTVVAYKPPPNFAGTDRFTYTVSDGSVTAVGTVTVYVTLLGAPAFDHLAVSGTPSNLLLSFSGIPGQVYDVQSAPAVSGPWTELFPTVVAPMSGLVRFTNSTAAAAPAQFFRMQLLP